MTTDVVLRETVSLPITVEQAVIEWEEYQQLTRALLDETDYQDIGGKPFKKKSAWRKYARAFNITDRVTFEQIERAPDGFPLWARIRVQAQAPNGRTAEADHECHLKERCTWKCEDCDGRQHWSHPGDLPATALTRAKNRAIADLIGAGEVTADEISEANSAPRRPPQQQAPRRAPQIIDADSGPPWDDADIPFEDEPDLDPAPLCGLCGNEVYDNRRDKRNPKAPDFKCKVCAAAAWLNNGTVKQWVPTRVNK